MSLLYVSTVKEFCRVSGTTEDDLIEVIVDQVEAHVSRFTGRLWTENTSHTQKISGDGRYLWPLVGPVNGIDSIEIIETSSTVDSSLYRLVDDNKILREADDRWGEDWRDYTLTANVGYNGIGDVPGDLTGLMYNLCARAYHSIGTVESESAAGHSITLRSLADTDEIKILRDYKMGPPA
jgi:hypothetical protein